MNININNLETTSNPLQSQENEIQETQLSDLPTEVFFHIFKYLHKQDFCKTLLVDKKFRDITLHTLEKYNQINNVFSHLCKYISGYKNIESISEIESYSKKCINSIYDSINTYNPKYIGLESHISSIIDTDPFNGFMKNYAIQYLEKAYSELHECHEKGHCCKFYCLDIRVLPTNNVFSEYDFIPKQIKYFSLKFSPDGFIKLTNNQVNFVIDAIQHLQSAQHLEKYNLTINGTCFTDEHIEKIFNTLSFQKLNHLDISKFRDVEKAKDQYQILNKYFKEIFVYEGGCSINVETHTQKYHNAWFSCSNPKKLGSFRVSR